MTKTEVIEKDAAKPPVRKGRRTLLRQFFEHEAAGGVVLMGSAVLALLVANSSFAPAYFAILGQYIGGLSVLHWINDGLMALFFLLVGLEIKRELLAGSLRTWPDRLLPGIGALGGMIGPALIYAALNWSNATHLRGWAIPMATDIAFALGILSLLGSRVPVSLKILLAALAIVDDLGAVIVIALFYTADISGMMLGFAGLTLAVLVAMNILGVRQLWLYLLVGAALWFFVLRSGVHATVAGVLLGMTIPLTGTDDEPEQSPLYRLEHGLHPWSAFLIVPIFGFANAGVSFTGMSPETLSHPVTLGIILGLFVGKQIGVFGAMALAIMTGLAVRPANATVWQVYGLSLLAGIGFTMSLFIGLLAFPGSAALEAETKIGVLVGSLISMIVGAAVLLTADARKPKVAAAA